MNCPNCGAPVRDASCEYCGTQLALDLSILQGKELRVSFEHDGCAQAFCMYVDSVSFEHRFDTLYSDGGIYGRLFHCTDVRIEGTVKR